MKYRHLIGISFATIFGLTFLFSKTALSYVSPMGLLAYRFTLAWLIFFILIIFKMIKIEINKKAIKFLILSGLFQPVIYFLSETYGLKYISSSEAGLMIAMIPIFVTILSALFLNEKPVGIQYFFMAISIIGVIVIQSSEFGNSTSSWIGYILLFLAVISASFFNIISRHVSKTISPFTATFFMTSIGAIIFNIIYLTDLAINNQLDLYILNLMHLELLIPIIYLGAVASIGGFVLVNLSLKHSPAHVSSIYSNISTVVALIAGLLILHEYLSIFHYIGAFMIVLGVYGTVRFQKYKMIKGE